MTELDRTSKVKRSFNLKALVIVLLFSLSAFSQSTTSNSLSEESAPLSTSTQVSTSRSSANMEFVLWFMGSKQNPNTVISTEASTSARNQIITSGLAPNRLLLKAFLKKAVNYESSLS
ncbi:hypothetical protein [Flavobacterium algicola]|uniref:hypothetical protein n=1 Tax=Flavobacterium algicola TaxID=556529 RepID=UPI001EFD44AB|nr:hypothetical protein [Flavobacterium algicola]MCG9791222.1 hypothetical protein [Flavobacterium algicola]